MFYKKIILTAVAALGIMLFFDTEYYTMWRERFLQNPNAAFEDQVKQTSVEERREYRYQATYRLCQQMKKTLEYYHVKPESATVLLPPNDFLAANHIDFKVAEPAEIYYHIGIRCLWTTSPDVNQANWALIFAAPGGQLRADLVPIKDKQQLQQLLDTYKNYKPAL